MPLVLFEWLQGQFHILFRRQIDSFANVIEALEETLSVRFPSTESEPLGWILQHTLIHQDSVLETVHLYNISVSFLSYSL